MVVSQVSSLWFKTLTTQLPVLVYSSRAGGETSHRLRSYQWTEGEGAAAGGACGAAGIWAAVSPPPALLALCFDLPSPLLAAGFPKGKEPF